MKTYIITVEEILHSKSTYRYYEIDAESKEEAREDFIDSTMIDIYGDGENASSFQGDVIIIDIEEKSDV